MKKSPASPTLYVRVMGSLAVGKTAFVSSTVSRSSQRRSVPYMKSRYNQQYATNVKSPSGVPIMVHLLDSRGNETLENLTHEALQSYDEHDPLLNTEETEWCYLLIYDYTRRDTFYHVKSLVEEIRMHDAKRSGIGRRRFSQAVIVLVGNKRDMCVAPSLSAWIKEEQDYAKEKQLFLFSGSAHESNFQCLSSYKFVYPALGQDYSDNEDAPAFRFSNEQILYLFKAKLDSDLRKGEYSRRKKLDPNSQITSGNQHENVEEEASIKNCWHCCRRRKQI